MRKEDNERKKTRQRVDPLSEKCISPTRENVKAATSIKSVPFGSSRSLLIFERILNRASSQLKRKKTSEIARPKQMQLSFQNILKSTCKASEVTLKLN